MKLSYDKWYKHNINETKEDIDPLVHFVSYYDKNNVQVEHYQLNSKYHRINGPAHIQYYWGNQIKRLIFYNNGLINNYKDPADVEYFITGKIKKVSYYKWDTLCNLNGPSIIEYDEEGRTIKNLFYICGLPYNIKEFYKVSRIIKKFINKYKKLKKLKFVNKSKLYFSKDICWSISNYLF